MQTVSESLLPLTPNQFILEVRRLSFIICSLPQKILLFFSNLSLAQSPLLLVP